MASYKPVARKETKPDKLASFKDYLAKQKQREGAL